MIRVQGTEEEIVALLQDLYLYGDTELEAGSTEVASAILKLAEGNASVTCSGRTYQIVELVLTIEQDVYGCVHGRACQSVNKQERARAEEMIANRLLG